MHGLLQGPTVPKHDSHRAGTDYEIFELNDVGVGMQLFQQSRNFKLLMARLASFSLFMKRFLQNLPPYLSEILSAFSLKLPSKSAKMTILEGN